MSAVPDFRDDTERMASLYGRPEGKLDSLRVLPQSAEAEQSVLGGLMLSPESLPKIADWLTGEDFYRPNHRLIFRGIVDLAEAGKPVDAVTLGEWFEANGLAEQIGGSGYLVELHSATPSAANIVAYAEIVAEKARLRQAIEIGTALTNAAWERGAAAADVTAKAQHALTTLAPVRHTGLQESKPGLMRWWAECQARLDKPGLLGLPTPWAGLNSATHGLRPANLYLLAGRPSMGKSIVGGQLAAFTALRGNRTALFSLEMSAESIHQRNVAALAEVPHDFLEQPTEASPHWAPMTPAIAQLRSAPLLIDDSPGLNAAQICARAERAHLQSGLSLIVVDHLHEMTVDPKDRVNSLGDAARKLKGLAKRLNVPVLLLAQLNRSATQRENKRPDLSDLRGSGSLEEVADAVMFLHREDYYRPETHLKGVVELILAKGRNLRTCTVHLANRYDQMRADDWEGPLPEAPQPEQKPATRERGFDAKRAAGGDR